MEREWEENCRKGEGCYLGADDGLHMHLRAVFKHCLNHPSTLHPPTFHPLDHPYSQVSQIAISHLERVKGKGAICIEALRASGIHWGLSSAHTAGQWVQVLGKDGLIEVQRGGLTSLYYTVCKRQCQNANSHLKILTKTYMLPFKK